MISCSRIGFISINKSTLVYIIYHQIIIAIPIQVTNRKIGHRYKSCELSAEIRCKSNRNV